MMMVKITALVCAAVLMVGASEGMAAQPVIKDFSSTGGNPQNKTGSKDTMYLVRPGDKITFAVKAEGAEKYEWQVNKEVDKEASGETFAWTVPDKKGIWEIHLIASGPAAPVADEARLTEAERKQGFGGSTAPVASEAPSQARGRVRTA